MSKIPISFDEDSQGSDGTEEDRDHKDPPLNEKVYHKLAKFVFAIYLRINFTTNRFSLALARTRDPSPISWREDQSNI